MPSGVAYPCLDMSLVKKTAYQLHSARHTEAGTSLKWTFSIRWGTILTSSSCMRVFLPTSDSMEESMSRLVSTRSEILISEGGWSLRGSGFGAVVNAIHCCHHLYFRTNHVSPSFLVLDSWSNIRITMLFSSLGEEGSKPIWTFIAWFIWLFFLAWYSTCLRATNNFTPKFVSLAHSKNSSRVISSLSSLNGLFSFCSLLDSPGDSFFHLLAVVVILSHLK